MKEFTKERQKGFNESVLRFKKAMDNCKTKGQVIAINFKKGTIIKSKCKKGKKAA